jgi:hypothetical protein
METSNVTATLVAPWDKEFITKYCIIESNTNEHIIEEVPSALMNYLVIFKNATIRADEIIINSLSAYTKSIGNYVPTNKTIILRNSTISVIPYTFTFYVVLNLDNKSIITRTPIIIARNYTLLLDKSIVNIYRGRIIDTIIIKGNYISIKVLYVLSPSWKEASIVAEVMDVNIDTAYEPRKVSYLQSYLEDFTSVTMVSTFTTIILLVSYYTTYCLSHIRRWKSLAR